jgi:hypothetical protein
MAFSRQFKALGRIASFFAAAFGAVGVVAGVITGGFVPSTLMTFAVAYGALGGMSGALTGLLMARSESGRRIEDVETSRIALWGVVGGTAPAALFALLGFIFGGSATALIPLIGLGVVGGALGGAISGSASAAAKRGALKAGESHTQLPG